MQSTRRVQETIVTTVPLQQQTILCSAYFLLCLTFAYYQRSFVNIHLQFSQLNELFMNL